MYSQKCTVKKSKAKNGQYLKSIFIYFFDISIVERKEI